MKHTQAPWFVSMQGVRKNTGERRVLIGFKKGVVLGKAVDDKNLIAAALDMKRLLSLILTRLDLEPPEAIFPCSALREDIRKVLKGIEG